MVEVDVAGLIHRTEQIDGAVAFLLPILEGYPAQMELSSAAQAVHGCQGAFLEAGGGHDDLEDGARRVLRLDRPVQEGMGRILDDGQPCRAIDGAREAVDVEGRRGDHGQHVAVARIQDHHGPRVSGHGLLGRLLDAAVDGGDDLCPRSRLRTPDDTQVAPERIDLDALAPVLTSQVVIEQSLEPGLPHHVAPSVKPLPELLVADLAHVAQQVGGEAAGRVDALRLDLHDHARELELPLLDLGHVLERQAAAHPHGSRGITVNAGRHLRELAIGNAEQGRHAAEHGGAPVPRLVELARNEREGEGRTVVDERPMLAIVENTALGGDRSYPDPVLLRGLAEVVPRDDLQIPELGHDDQEGDADHGCHHDHPPLAEVAPVGDHNDRLTRRYSATVRTSTTAAPRKPL